MKISIFGLGYAGCVSAACFAKEGHKVIGVDINKRKIDLINKGRSPVIEEGMDALIKKVTQSGNLRATDDAKEAVLGTEITFICVGTPGKPNGSLNYDIIEKACFDIGKVLKKKNKSHIIVIRSTILPGCIKDKVIPAIEKESGKREGEGFFISVNPEFLREGSSVKDFYNPPFILVGLGNRKKGSKELKELYKNINAGYIETSIEISEMIKYTSNAFHALKVVFANEIGQICKSLGIDSYEVMRIFCLDKKLNISDKYLKPGFAFGGSCLPKDLRAMAYEAKQRDIEIPLLGSLLPSNRTHFDKAVEFILSLKRNRIGILGISFKEGTDDLRESPNVALAEALIGKGLDVSIYDKNVALAKLTGTNKEFIARQIPHISKLIKPSPEEVISGSEVIIVGTKDVGKETLMRYAKSKQIIFDLVRIFDSPEGLKPEYHGVCW